MTFEKLMKLAKPSILMLFAVGFSLSASRATSANSRTTAPAKVATIERNAKRAKRALLPINNRTTKTNPKLARLISACNCAVAPVQGGFVSCFKNCMLDSGVNAASLAACGVVCSSNPVGCAICVGVAEWVALACAQYCAWRRVFYNTEASLRPSRMRGVQPIKRIPKPVTVVT